MIEISIIVPVYNTEKYITRCINSILEQTFENWELLLIDDGSRDSSGKICDIFQKKDSRIKVIHKKNEGVSIARNLGITLSKGNYITFIDSDDWVENDYLEIMYKMIKIMNVDILVTGCLYKEKNRVYNPFSIGKEQVYNRDDFQIEFFKQDKFMWTIYDKLYKKYLFKNHKFDIRLKIAEDMMLFWELISEAKRIGYYPLYKYYYDKTASQTMTSEFSSKWLHPLKVKQKIYISIRKKSYKHKFLSKCVYVGEIAGLMRKLLIHNKKIYFFKMLQKRLRRNIFFAFYSPFSNVLSYRQRIGIIFCSLPKKICFIFNRFL